MGDTNLLNGMILQAKFSPNIVVIFSPRSGGFLWGVLKLYPSGTYKPVKIGESIRYIPENWRLGDGSVVEDFFWGDTMEILRVTKETRNLMGICKFPQLTLPEN